MKVFKYLCIACMLLPATIQCQVTYKLMGRILDENNISLPGAYIILNGGEKSMITGKEGSFSISGLKNGNYVLEVSYLGYEKYKDTLLIASDWFVEVHLKPETRLLDEVVVRGDYDMARKKEEPVSVEVVKDDYLKSNLSGSLVKSLERLPGISAIEIGSGQSKPVIRGLSFNRVVVVENGVKHEGQQWGEDHGLEIDQYAVDRVEIIKGPASLMYGSDAIGGIINLEHAGIPTENLIGGSVDITGKSNNNLMGFSANLYACKNKVFINSRLTLVDYADYRVPTDSVDIYSYRAPLYKNRLRNSAGNEQDIHLTLGIIGKTSLTRLFISNLRSKSGFFANAHGLEPRQVDTDLHDKSDRDVQYPYQTVNHFKMIGKSDFQLRQYKFEVELGYQHNFREEWNQYVSHGYMPAILPEECGFPANLELQFNKDVYSVNLNGTFPLTSQASLVTGLCSEYQHNQTGGRGFIIPAFRQFTSGLFMYYRNALNEKTILHAGIRYDYGKINTNEYFDWFQSTEINENGDTTGYSFLQRADRLNRRFKSVCWSLGLNYNMGYINLKANLGKSFRMPIAKELAANGVNYHHFCYETGNPDLDPEVSYQLDLGAEWNNSRLSLGINPFINYFPNYIFLNPSYEHDYFYGAGNQVYYYTQTKVFRFGGELTFHYDLLKQIGFNLTGEYIYSEQLSGEKKGFSLPFSPPANLLFNLKYTPALGKEFHETYFSFDCNVVAAQNKVVPPEEKTPGYQTFDISVGSQIRMGKQQATVNFQIRNFFNTRYFNHTSYYRIINVPEPGRSFILNISLPLESAIGNNKH